MAILFMIFRKLIANRWLASSLLLGMVIAVALVASIPAFTAGVLQRVLIKDLEDYQKRSNQYPGGLELTLHFNKAKPSNPAIVNNVASAVEQIVYAPLQIPSLVKVTMLQSIPLVATNDKNVSGSSATINGFTEIEQHVTLIDGRLPNPTGKDGIYEALVTEGAMKKRKMVLNTEFRMETPDHKQIRIKVVGVITENGGADPYWFTSADQYSNSFIIPYNEMKNKLLAEHPILSTAKLYTAFDYYRIMVADKEKFLGLEGALKAQAFPLGLEKSEFSFRFPVGVILSKYDEKRGQFETILWSLYVPVFLMLALYLVMVVSLIIDRQRTEIAVLGSRGGSSRQIFMVYVLEIMVLGGIAFAVGPYLGVFLSRVLGVSNGFLEFVNRTAVPVQVTAEIFWYALYTVVACIIILLIPVSLATRQNIISHKQTVARMTGRAIWHRLYLDVLLLLVSGYGWYSYQRTVKMMQEQGMQQVTLNVEALLFFVPVMFVLGMGLLSLRLYPFLLKAIFAIGRRFWSPAIYTTLIQVGRSSRQHQFLMMFIVVTVAVGLYSSSMARTLNENVEEQIRYRGGADIRMKVEWEDDQPVRLLVRGAKSGGLENTLPVPEKEALITYVEPPFEPYKKLPGVEHATRVFLKSVARVKTGQRELEGVQLMAIDPKDFGMTAWFQPRLLPHHWYHYLNLLAKEPSSVLISRTLAEKAGLEPGSMFTLDWNGGRPADFIVYGIVDYWPSWNPQPTSEGYGQDEQSFLIVANLQQVQDKMWKEPYEVWLKLHPGASTETLYEALKQQQIPVTSLQNVNQDLIRTKTSAFYLGMNGSLTLGFLLSMIITFSGYLIYWVLTMGARKLQYGVFRAMGLKFSELTWMIAWEQLLTFGVAFGLGIGIGKLCNALFLPALSIYVGAQQVPPFRIVSRQSDEWIIYGFIGITLLIGLTILAVLLSRLQIHQAVKLGED
ncbi:MAG: ABC transporter permease [Clostridia bacterium]